MKLRPTKKTISLSLGALLLFGLGANAQAGWLYVIGAALAGVLIAGMTLPVFALRKLEATRQTSPVTRVGDRISATLQLENRSSSRRGPIVGEDRFLVSSRGSNAEANRFIVDSIKGHGSASVTYETTAERRGVYGSTNLALRSGAPFGVAVASRKLEVSSSTIVHPRWVSLVNFPLLEAASAPQESDHDRSRRGSGMDFYGLREHRSGDSLRHVHWRSSAKGDRLLVREYEEHLASRLSIFIDGSQNLGTEPRTTFESSMAVAASIVIYAMGAGHPIQATCSTAKGSQHLFEPSRNEALDWMAGLEAGGGSGLLEMVNDEATEVLRRSTVVLIFPATPNNLSEASDAVTTLQERAARVITIVISAQRSGDRHSISDAEEQRLLNELSQLRAIVYRVTSEDEVMECLRTPHSV